MRRAMKINYIYALLSFVLALNFAPAIAQTKHPAKNPAHKVVKKKAVRSVAVKRTTAKNLGDAAAKVTVDTTKKATPANTNNPGGLSEEIVVTTAYKPVLADAVKIRRNPDLDDKTPYKAPLSYLPLDKPLAQNSDIKRLDAMQRPAEKDSDRTNNYVKVGVGNLKTTFGEVYLNNGKDQALQYGGYLKHFAQNGSLYKQNTDNGQIGAFIKSIGTDFSVTGKVGYDYKSNYFYGYDQPAPAPVLQQVNKEHFNTIGGEIELAKNYKDVENAFTYALKIKAYSFSNAYHAKENDVVISGFLNQTINQFYAGLSTSLDLSSQKDNLFNQSNNLLQINPYIKFQGDNYKIDAGITIVDQSGYSSKFYVFPAAKLEYQVIPKYVRLFVEAKGDVNRSSLHDFYITNPFLGQNLDVRNSVDELDVSGGIKGTIAPGLGFKVSVFRNVVKNMPLFVSDFNLATGYNRFKVIYDPGRAQVSGIMGDLDYKASESVDIFGHAEFDKYNMTDNIQAWNLPKYKITAGTTIHINSKINVTGTLFVRGNTIDPLNPSGITNAVTSIKSFADVSAEAEYRITKRLSAFIHVNNLLNGSNKIWVYYPDYGFNIFGGIGYSF